MKLVRLGKPRAEPRGGAVLERAVARCGEGKGAAPTSRDVVPLRTGPTSETLAVSPKWRQTRPSTS